MIVFRPGAERAHTFVSLLRARVVTKSEGVGGLHARGLVVLVQQGSERLRDGGRPVVGNGEGGGGTGSDITQVPEALEWRASSTTTAVTA